MIENCAACGNELDDNVKFCPNCGEKVVSEKKIEKNNAEFKTKKSNMKLKLNLPKISFIDKPKPVLAGFALLCIAIIVIAGVVIISPFDLSGAVSSSGEKDIGSRVFVINIDNTCEEKAKCYLTVSGLRYTQIGSTADKGEFSINSGESISINIIEEALFKICDSYEISLFVEFDHLEKATVYDITESVDFSINPMDLEGEFAIDSSNAI